MPVALVVTDLDVGGAERALVALATRVNRARWSPQVFCLGPHGALVDVLNAAGLPPVCLNVSRKRPAQAVAHLVRAMKVQRPKLVQSFLFHANVAARLAAPLVGSPWVLSGVRVAERQKRWHLTVDRLTAWLATGQVCVSEGVYRFCRDVEGVPADRLTIIPNGVDTTLYDGVVPIPRDQVGVPEGAHVVLYVGRLDTQKGLSFLLDAAERVAAQRDNWHLVMVGDGPDREDLLQRIAASPRLSPRVQWLGRRSDVPGLLETADLLVLPSVWEGMPNVVLEAMAARRAVVATRVEGSEDLILPGRTGWLVPPRDAEALAGALLDAASDPGRLREFGAVGRARVEAEYSLSATIVAYERLWSGVLGLADPCLTPDAAISEGASLAD